VNLRSPPTKTPYPRDPTSQIYPTELDLELEPMSDNSLSDKLDHSGEAGYQRNIFTNLINEKSLHAPRLDENQVPEYGKRDTKAIHESSPDVVSKGNSTISKEADIEYPSTRRVLPIAFCLVICTIIFGIDRTIISTAGYSEYYC
jgi:hypothetical protein